MKTILAAMMCVALTCATLGGCAKATSTTPTTAVAPGYQNLTDEQIGQIIAGATAFYDHVQTDVQSKAYTPSATELTALNAFGVTLNAAKTVYGAYHNGTATLAQAQTAANLVTTQQTALQSTITGAQ